MLHSENKVFIIIIILCSLMGFFLGDVISWNRPKMVHFDIHMRLNEGHNNGLKSPEHGFGINIGKI